MLKLNMVLSAKNNSIAFVLQKFSEKYLNCDNSENKSPFSAYLKIAKLF